MTSIRSIPNVPKLALPNSFGNAAYRHRLNEEYPLIQDLLRSMFPGSHEPITSMQADGWVPIVDSGRIKNMVNVPCRAILTSSWPADGFVFTAEGLVDWMEAFYHQKNVHSADALEQTLIFVPVGLNQNTCWNGYGQGIMRQPMIVNPLRVI